MKYSKGAQFFVSAAITLLLLLFTACGGDSKNNNVFVPISVSPKTLRVEAGKSATLTVIARNANFTVDLSPNTGDYEINGNRVIYTAPANISAETTVNLTVTATGDTTKSDTARITIWVPENPGDDNEIVFTTINRPGAAHTFLYGINNYDKIIGESIDNAGKETAFLKDGGSYITIDNPIGIEGYSHAFGINDLGHILFFYEENGYFLKTEYGYDHLEDYREAYTEYSGINNSGQLSGYFKRSNGVYRGFVRTGDDYEEITHPNAMSTACANVECGTFIMGINNSGHLAGYYKNADGVYRGFVKTGNTYTSIVHPDSRPNREINIYVTGINDSGQIAGYFWGSDNYAYGFVKDGDRFIELHHPSAANDGYGTWASGINNSGQIVGYFDDGQKINGFLLENLLGNAD